MILTCFLHFTDSEIDITFGLISYPCTPLNNLPNKHRRQVGSKYNNLSQLDNHCHVSNNLFKNNDFQQKVLLNFKGMKNEFYIRSF